MEAGQRRCAAAAGVAAGDGAGVVATSGVTAGGCRTTPRRGKADPAGVRAGGGGMRSLPAAGVTAAVWEPVCLGVGAIAALTGFCNKAPALR